MQQFFFLRRRGGGGGGGEQGELCSSKNIHTPPGGDFSFRPPTPGKSVIFQLD